ncbi:hypothetical protein [Kitasatospora purpeofusca]|uniref:hypothetical protein n=1 Tax=Kitasatospora purpeofusca TaxID=67352 RepID=UPI0036799616
MTITFPEAVNFLTTQASREDLATLEATAEVRRKTLRSKRADAITTGMNVELEKLGTKYMNGLSGEVVEIQRPRTGEPRAVVRLDERSFQTIQLYKYISPTTKHYSLRVPLGCCKELTTPTKPS